MVMPPGLRVDRLRSAIAEIVEDDPAARLEVTSCDIVGLRGQVRVRRLDGDVVESHEFDVDVEAAWDNALELGYGDATTPGGDEPDPSSALGSYLGLRFVELILTQQARTDGKTAVR